MSRRLLTAAVAAAIACLAGSAQAALYAIASPRLSAGVDPQSYAAIQPAEGSVSRGQLTSGLLYFSLTIVGDERTFQHLEENGSLGLEVALWADGRRRSAVAIGMSTRDWEKDRDRLRSELAQFGVFSWRTYMNTRQIGFSRIELVLRDDNNAVVAPLGHRGTYQARITIVP